MSNIFRGPSPKLMVIVLVIGIGLIFFGEYYYSSGRRLYGVEGSAMPTLIGLALLVIDAVMLAIWRVQRDKPSALEGPLHRDDPNA
jgi:hypothetical protein